MTAVQCWCCAEHGIAVAADGGDGLCSPCRDRSPQACREAHKRPRVMMEDLSLPHQIVIRLGANSKHLAVSCTCLPGTERIALRPTVTAGEAHQLWAEHVTLAGAA